MIYSYFHLESKHFRDQFSQHQQKTRDIYLFAALNFTSDNDWNGQDHLCPNAFPLRVRYLKNDGRLPTPSAASRNTHGLSVWHLPPWVRFSTYFVNICMRLSWRENVSAELRIKHIITMSSFIYVDLALCSSLGTLFFNFVQEMLIKHITMT